MPSRSLETFNHGFGSESTVPLGQLQFNWPNYAVMTPVKGYGDQRDTMQYPPTSNCCLYCAVVLGENIYFMKLDCSLLR
jgi:hypothetical protein